MFLPEREATKSLLMNKIFSIERDKGMPVWVSFYLYVCSDKEYDVIIMLIFLIFKSALSEPGEWL